MDTNLVFPAPQVADPPPPLHKLLVDLLENADASEISVTNPLTVQNIPDSLEARTAIHSLGRIRQALTTPFNTPDRCFGREDWMKLVLEVLAAVHSGLRSCQLASPEGQGKVADTFFDLTTMEEAIASCSQEVIDDLTGFYWTDSSPEDITKMHCFRCVQTADVDTTSNAELLQSIQLNTALDKRKLRETLLNEAIRETHKEVDEWRKSQRDLLISFITEMIINDMEMTADKLADAVYHLPPAYTTWVGKYQSRMRAYVRKSISKTVGEDMLDPYGRELLDEAITKRIKACETEADGSFHRDVIFAARLQTLTKELE
jgi:hypothetical protein